MKYFGVFWYKELISKYEKAKGDHTRSTCQCFQICLEIKISYLVVPMYQELGRVS